MSAVLTRAIPRIARGACGYSANVGLGSIATVSRCPRYVRFSSDSDQIADVPTRRIKCAPAAPETACEPQVHPCAEQRPRTSRTRAPVALTDPSEPWWTSWFTHFNFKVFRGQAETGRARSRPARRAQRKCRRRGNREHKHRPKPARQSPTLLIGRIEETSASFVRASILPDSHSSGRSR